MRTAPSSRRNIAWVVVWVGLGLALGLWVAATQGLTVATEYFAAYLLEESLSVDNIFVFVIIFSELHIPAEHQRRVLLFGIVGALVFRALAIGAGITLIERCEAITDKPSRNAQEAFDFFPYAEVCNEEG